MPEELIADDPRGIDSPPTRRRTTPAVQFARYFGVSGIALAVDVLVLITLTGGMGLGSLAGATAGFLSGLLVTWVLSERCVFTEPKITRPGARFAAFAAIGLIGLVLLDLLMWILTEQLGLFYLWSKVLATGLVYAWNFVARRRLYAA